VEFSGESRRGISDFSQEGSKMIQNEKMEALMGRVNWQMAKAHFCEMRKASRSGEIARNPDGTVLARIMIHGAAAGGASFKDIIDRGKTIL